MTIYHINETIKSDGLKFNVERTGSNEEMKVIWEGQGNIGGTSILVFSVRYNRSTMLFNLSR